MSLRRLTRHECAALEDALTPHDLVPALRWGLELWLTGYRDRARVASAADRARWRNEERQLVTLATALERLIQRASPEDAQEAILAGTKRSALGAALVQRVAEWTARKREGWTMSRPFDREAVVVNFGQRGRPPEAARRDLLRRALSVLRDSGLPNSSGEILRRQTAERVLDVVLQIADTIDGRPSAGAVRSRLVREAVKGTKFGRSL